MLFAVAANEIWLFGFNILFSAGTAEDMKFAFTFPTSGRIDASAGVMPNAGGAATLTLHSSNTSPTTATDVGGQGTGVRVFMPVGGIFTNSTNAGNVTLQWAQNTSGANDTTVYANSTLWAVKLA